MEKWMLIINLQKGAIDDIVTTYSDFYIAGDESYQSHTHSATSMKAMEKYKTLFLFLITDHLQQIKDIITKKSCVNLAAY